MGQIPRPPNFLTGWKDIGDEYGTTRTQPKIWYDLGAPIIMINMKQVAEAWDLWCWLKDEFG
jgi:hypothetical protein